MLSNEIFDNAQAYQLEKRDDNLIVLTKVFENGNSKVTTQRALNGHELLGQWQQQAASLEDQITTLKKRYTALITQINSLSTLTNQIPSNEEADNVN